MPQLEHADRARQRVGLLLQRGVPALGVPTDVGDRHAVASLAQAAMARFGRIDTWINNAGVSIFGTNEEVPMEDHERLFQTNFWGVVYGSLEAVRHMKKSGGALINLGSEVSDRAVPLQGMYSASKHAVKGFTDSLRMELEKERAPLSVTLIKPAAIDTLFTRHARNHMAQEPALPPPVYAPELAADAILHAAQHPERDLFVGAASKLISMAGSSLPRVLDKYMEMLMFRQQRSSQPSAANRKDALYSADPSQELRQRLGSARRVHEDCAYTRLAMRSKKPLALAPLRIKAGAPDDVEQCVLTAMPGVKLTHAPQVPAAIPLRPDTCYFTLENRGVLYEQMLKSQSIAIYVPAGIRELRLELIAALAVPELGREQ
eukprot:gene38383-47388_t